MNRQVVKVLDDPVQVAHILLGISGLQGFLAVFDPGFIEAVGGTSFDFIGTDAIEYPHQKVAVY